MSDKGAPPAAWMVEAAGEMHDQLCDSAGCEVSTVQAVEHRLRSAAIIAKHAPAPEREERERLLEFAWGVIANVSGGNWKLQREDWQAAAHRWGVDAGFRAEEREPSAPAPVYVQGPLHERDACPICLKREAPAPASPTVADHCGHPMPNWEGQAMKCVRPLPCPDHAPTAHVTAKDHPCVLPQHPFEPEHMRLDSDLCWKCGLPRSAHPAAAPEPPAIDFERSVPEAIFRAPAPSVQPARCQKCGYNHDYGRGYECEQQIRLGNAARNFGKAPEPAAQDRLGAVTRRLCDKFRWPPTEHHEECSDCPAIRAELARVVRLDMQISDSVNGENIRRYWSLKP